MINIKTLPKDTAAELLKYLAEHEDFRSIEALGAGDVTSVEIKALLRELANQLAVEASEMRASYDVKSCGILSKKSKNIISCLSPREEKSLLSAFGLIEEENKP